MRLCFNFLLKFASKLQVFEPQIRKIIPLLQFRDLLTLLRSCVSSSVFLMDVNRDIYMVCICYFLLLRNTLLKLRIYTHTHKHTRSHTHTHTHTHTQTHQHTNTYTHDKGCKILRFQRFLERLCVSVKVFGKVWSWGGEAPWSVGFVCEKDVCVCE
jgi:hypothetical protein